MLNFAPTEEQEEIRRLAHSIAVEHLRIQGRPSEKSGDISPDLMHTIAQTGLTSPFSEDPSESELIEAVTYTLIVEELGFGDGALAINIIGSMMGPVTIMLSGQNPHYMTPFLDEQNGYKQRGSLAFAERTGGYSLADIRATIRHEGDHWIVNGTKRDVLHGSTANPKVVLVRLEDTPDRYAPDLLAFILDDNTNVQIQNDVQKLGLIAAPSASYIFENTIVGPEQILGDTDQLIRAATFYQIMRASVACGMARAAFEYAKDYARERIAFGRPIASYQGIAFIVAEMAMKLDAARLLVWRAAASWDKSYRWFEGYGDEEVLFETLIQESEAAQYQAVKLAKSATLDAIQVMGGAGFIQDHPVEMWARNAAAME